MISNPERVISTAPSGHPDVTAVTLPKSIAILIVTYNSADVLKDCLLSLSDGSRGVHLAHVVVADNNSRDDSVRVAESVPGLPVRVVQVGRNAGYAAAINAALAQLDLAELDAVLVLNPDCRIRSGALALLAEVLNQPRRGIAVPRLLNPDGTLQPSLRWTPSITRAFGEAVLGGTRTGQSKLLGELVTDPDHYSTPGPADWATGAVLLISTALIREIGGWDESFLLFGEEVEYALRAGDRGWTLWYEPAAVVEHDGGESGANPMFAALIAVNRVRLFRRRRGALAGGVYFLVEALGAALRAVGGRPASRAALRALLRPSTRLRQLPD